MKKFFAFLLFTLLAAFSVNTMASSQCSAPNPNSDHWPPNITVGVSNDIVVAAPDMMDVYVYSAVPTNETGIEAETTVLFEAMEAETACEAGLCAIYLDNYIQGFMRHDKTLNPVLRFTDNGVESNGLWLPNRLDQFRWPLTSSPIADSKNNYQLGKS